VGFPALSPHNLLVRARTNRRGARRHNDSGNSRARRRPERPSRREGRKHGARRSANARVREHATNAYRTSVNPCLFAYAAVRRRNCPLYRGRRGTKRVAKRCAYRCGAAADAENSGQSRRPANQGARRDSQERSRRPLAVQGSGGAVLRRVSADLLLFIKA
jgi:hypothetical protein